MEPEVLPYVFDRFRQGDSSLARRHGGLGIGLAIVKSLVELHGGTVLARSDGPGQGATFVVKLPMAPLRADQAPPNSPDGPARKTFDSHPALGGLRVLVVDDEPHTRDMVAFLLAQCDSVVVTAGSMDEALERLHAERFDVRVSDVGMPGSDGYALIEAVRRLDPPRSEIPALALTAYARSEDRTRALRAGFSMHLAKPIEPDELVTVVAHLVGAHSRREGR
jgi:CheY-like chemotaxis protein